MSGPAKFWLCMILLAIGAVLALRRGGGESARAADETAANGTGSTSEALGETTAPGERPGGSGSAGATPSFGSVAIGDAVSSIQGRGPAIAVFFSPYCSISRGTVPRLARLAREEAAGVTFLGYAIDSAENPRELADFLARSGVGFETEILEEWAPGEFNASIRRFGVEIRDPWTMPLVVIVGEDGRALSAWEGVKDVDRIAGALRQAGWTTGS